MASARTGLLNAKNSSNHTSVDLGTASPSGTAGGLLVAWIGTAHFQGAPEPTSVTGLGVTWTNRGTVAWSNSDDERRLTLFTAPSGSATSGDVTINFGSSSALTYLQLEEWTEIDQTTPVVQVVSESGGVSGAATSNTLDFATLGSSDNPQSMATLINNSEAIDVGSGWTEGYENNDNGPQSAMQSQYGADDTTGAVSWQTSVRWGQLGVELAHDAGVVTGSGSIAATSAAAGTGSKIGAGSGSVTVATSSSGTGFKIGDPNIGQQGTPSLVAAVDIPGGAGYEIAKIGQGSGSVTVATSSSGAGEDVPEIPTGSGTIAATTAAAGTGAKIGQGSGSVTVATSSSGAGFERSPGSGTIAATTAVAATGAKVSDLRTGSGTIAATTAAAGTGSKIGAGSGSVTVATSASGAGFERSPGQGAIAVTTATAGAGVGLQGGAGVVAVTVTVAAAGLKISTGSATVTVTTAVGVTGGAVAPAGIGELELAVTVAGAGAKTLARATGEILVRTRPIGYREWAYLNGNPGLELVVQVATGAGALWGTAVWGTAEWVEDLEWVDASRWVASVTSRSSARAALNETFRAGSATVKLQNPEGLWTEPGASPGAVDLVPGRRLRIAVQLDATIDDAAELVPVWTGYVTTMREAYGRRGEATLTLSATDGLARLGAAKLPSGYYWKPGDASHVAVRKVLDAALWPTGTDWRSISTDTEHTLERYDPDGESALDVLKRIADAEGGSLYIDPEGRPRFEGRDWLTDTKGAAAELELDTEGFGEIGIRDIAPLERTDARVINEAIYRRASTDDPADNRYAWNGASKSIYGPRSLERFDLICETNGQVATLASRMVTHRNTSRSELRSVTVRPATRNEAVQLLGTVLGAVVDVDYVHPINGWSWAKVANLVGLEHKITKQGTWTVTLRTDTTYQEA